MTAYRLSPAWATQTRFTGASRSGQLEPCDLALALRVVGILGNEAPHDPRDADAFADSLRSAVACPDTECCGVEYQVGQFDAGYRHRDRFVRSIERLRYLRNGGALCFPAIDMTDDGKWATFHIARGAAIVPAHIALAKPGPPEERKEALASGDAFGDRPFVMVDPEPFGSFRSVSSVPVALRLLVWLTSGNRNGLPGRSVDRDRHGRWTIECGLDEIARLWGIAPARVDLAYYVGLFATVVHDLSRIGVTFSASPERVGRFRSNWTFRFHETSRLAAMLDPVCPIEEREDPGYLARLSRARPADDASRQLDRIVRDASRAAVAEVSSNEAEFDGEAFAPETEALDVATVPAEPFRPLRGRLRPIAWVDDPEPVAETAEGLAALAPIVDREAVPVPIPPAREPYVHVDRDDRKRLPPWLRRRLVHQHPEFDVLADKSLRTPEDRKRAWWSGVHVWCAGMDARPLRIHRVEPGNAVEVFQGLLNRTMHRGDWCRYEWYRVWDERDGVTVAPWHESEDRETSPYDPVDDDDFEGHEAAKHRLTPRDMTKLSGRPHDGFGFVDEEGNPIDEAGQPLAGETLSKRNRVVRMWDEYEA